MGPPELLEGIEQRAVRTARLETALLQRGEPGGVPLVLVHGNVSSSRFFEELMVGLGPAYRCLAPDLRGFGASEAVPVDATRGLRDFADDLAEVLDEPSVTEPGRPVHLLGWSLGGGVVMQYAIDHPERVASLTLLASMSPYGFGATRDLVGTPCSPSCAGSGGGLVAPEFIERLRTGDRSDHSKLSPRQVMLATYFKPPFRPAPEREEVFVSAILDTALGEGNYPGGAEVSPDWPGIAPGRRGVNNAFSPRYCDLSPVADLGDRAPVLWVRGADDVIVSDRSILDPAHLGQAGVIPGWPGEAFPPQPMVSQLRSVLQRLRDGGGEFTEEVFENCGHSPHLEHPERFRRLLDGFVTGAERRVRP